jgi:orotate phosphoribosyltransferase
MASLANHKSTFLQDCINAGALKFGTFTLKSKRISPYFFNAGLFHRADLLKSISTAYAKTLATSNPPLEFDILFGPAYKGIPLATAVTEKLADVDVKRYGQISYSFNRKEAKDHGEGGSIVGAPLKGKKVVIIDDVITAGTAIREAINIIKAEGGELVGIVVAFDRLEKTPPPPQSPFAGKDPSEDTEPRSSAIGEVRKQYGIPVLAILTLDDIVKHLKTLGTPEDVKRLEEYRARYKATD